MKKIVLFFVMILACTAFAVQASAAPKKVAVYVEGNVSADDKSVVSSAVLSRMSGNKDYTPFERNAAFIKAIEREYDYQLSGELPENEIRAVGERLGVDYVIVVNVVVKKNGMCHMSGRLIRIESFEILKSVNQQRQLEDSETIQDLANNVAYRLLNKKSK